MENLASLEFQVCQVLIDTNDTLSPYQLYSRFFNESNVLKLEEKDFYIKILKPAYKSINWDLVKPKNRESTRQVVMFCSECGNMNEEMGNYCAECGHSLDL